jgi:hypothetical protein
MIRAAMVVLLLVGCGTEEDAEQEQNLEAGSCVVANGCNEVCEPCPGHDNCTMCSNKMDYIECPPEKRQGNGCFDGILFECLNSFPENC